MASNTTATWNKREWKKAKNGRKRKNKEARHSTPSMADTSALPAALARLSASIPFPL